MVSARPGVRTRKKLVRTGRTCRKRQSGQGLPASHPPPCPDPILPLGRGEGTRLPVPGSQLDSPPWRRIGVRASGLSPWRSELAREERTVRSWGRGRSSLDLTGKVRPGLGTETELQILLR